MGKREERRRAKTETRQKKGKKLCPKCDSIMHEKFQLVKQCSFNPQYNTYYECSKCKHREGYRLKHER